MNYPRNSKIPFQEDFWKDNQNTILARHFTHPISHETSPSKNFIVQHNRLIMRPEKVYLFQKRLTALSRSEFRSRFHLKQNELQYIQNKGLETVVRHAQDFVRTRLAPAKIPNDGKQTPMRGHPVFIAQHATGTCCRNCLRKWYGITPNTALSREQQDYIVTMIMVWIQKQLNR